MLRSALFMADHHFTDDCNSQQIAHLSQWEDHDWVIVTANQQNSRQLQTTSRRTMSNLTQSSQRRPETSECLSVLSWSGGRQLIDIHGVQLWIQLCSRLQYTMKKGMSQTISARNDLFHDTRLATWSKLTPVPSRWLLCCWVEFVLFPRACVRRGSVTRPGVGTWRPAQQRRPSRHAAASGSDSLWSSTSSPHTDTGECQSTAADRETHFWNITTNKNVIRKWFTV